MYIYNIYVYIYIYVMLHIHNPFVAVTSRGACPGPLGQVLLEFDDFSTGHHRQRQALGGEVPWIQRSMAGWEI